MKPRPILVQIVTASMTADVLLRGQLRMLRENGFHVIVITSPDPILEEVAQREGVEIVSIAMAREISLLQDIQALFKLYRTLVKFQPDLVNASTPKAGLLGMLAARMARVPVRIYQQRGLRLETTTGAKRQILLQSERIAAASAHHVVCNSQSLKESCLALGIAEPSKLTVLGAGSSNGVDTSRFHPADEPTAGALNALRQQWAIPERAPVIGYVGRLTRDKGTVDLLDAFNSISRAQPNVHLLLVGQLEGGDPLPEQVVNRLHTDERIILTGHVSDTAPFYRLMDLLVFPSYREGFPNVPLEAAASALPVVGYQATGTIDAVLPGRTGFLVPVGDSLQLAQAIEQLLQDRDLRLSLGRAGREWVHATFDSHIVWQRWIQFYRDVLRDAA